MDTWNRRFPRFRDFPRMALRRAGFPIVRQFHFLGETALGISASVFRILRGRADFLDNLGFFR